MGGKELADPEHRTGFVRQAVDYLSELGVPVLRWPGGCFADDYHWRDGIGPMEKRPKRVNIWWGELHRGQQLRHARVHRLVPADRRRAVPGGQRRQRHAGKNCATGWSTAISRPAVRSRTNARRTAAASRSACSYWGVGNENWGCGGNMTGDEYAAHFKRYQTFARPFGDVRPFTIACGPNRNDVEWTRRFMSVAGPTASRARGTLPSGYAVHYYQNGRDVPTKFTVESMREQFSHVTRMEETIVTQRGLLDSYLQMPSPAQLPPGVTPQRPQVQLIVDEWGVWDRMIPEEEKNFGRLWMQSTMRSAVVGAMGLNVFHRQADKLYMCNIAQTVNVLQSVLLAHENHCIRTSSYYAFALQKPHRGKTAVRTSAGAESPMGISVSASRKDDELIVTLVNPKHDTAMKVNCALVGTNGTSVRAQMLHHADHNACNTFEQPNVIVPREHAASIAGGRLTMDLPAMSIVTATIRLAS